MPYYRLFYHFVWATKDRLPLLAPANRDRIYAAVADKVLEANGIVHAIGGTSDHVHLVASLPPSVCLSSFVGQAKGVSSHLATTLAGGQAMAFAWQGDYAVLSLSESHLARAVAYVRRQAEHHAQNSLLAELETY